MQTVLYLVRHGATAANLTQPSLLQGCRADPPLAPEGVRQALATRTHLADVPFAAVFTSPLRRARHTAELIAPNLTPTELPWLTECDIGRWEGTDWDTIRQTEPTLFERHWSDPGRHGYPDGENFGAVFARTTATIDELLDDNAGKSILVVTHHVVCRSYLTVVSGKPLSLARELSVENCGVSVVVRDSGKTRVTVLNDTQHLRAAAA